MSRRAVGQKSVQLFPFLAVLVCVMGALILLLLVTTRQLRARALHRATALVAGSADSVSEPAPTSDETPWRPVPPPPAGEPPSPAEESDEQRTASGEQRTALLAELEQKQAALHQLASAVSHQRLLAAAADKRLRELEREVAHLERQRGLLSGQTAATRLAAPDMDAERVQLEQRIQQLRRRLKQLEDQQRDASGQFAIIPFEGKSGTTRKPIYIECTDTGFRFLPENVVIRPGDIEGFSERYNPLLAGAVALSTYWGQHATGTDDEPYVLLIVRPNGTLAYYIAQRLLARLKQPHGYELVPADLELHLPPVDAGAQAAVAAAVARLLAEREQLLRPAPAAGETRGKGASAQGQGRGAATSGGNEKFSMSHLDRTPQVGNRSWERIDNFEGKEFRRAGSAARSIANDATASRPGSPPAHQQPSSDSAAPAPGVETADVPPAANGGRKGPGGEADAVTTAEYKEADFPAFAPKSSSRGPERSLPYEHLQRRKWGQYGPNATIGLEHEIKVRVEAQRLIVDDAVSISIPGGLSRTELFDRLLSVIDRRASTWGMAPNGFFWIPKLKFVVSPGGQGVYERLAPLVSKSGLGYSTVHELEQ
jgi:hypothetical protein